MNALIYQLLRLARAEQLQQCGTETPMAAVHGEEKLIGANVTVGRHHWWALPAGSRSCSSTSCKENEKLLAEGRPATYHRR